jgi:cytochrome c-type biogenesis protein CcmH
MNPFWTVSLFWLAALVCVVIALAFVLPSLLRVRTGEDKAVRRDVNIAVYRDQMKEMAVDRANGLLSEEQFQAAKRELEARLAEDALAADDAPQIARGNSHKLGYAMGAMLPLAAFSLYFWLGNPMSLIAIADAQAGPAHPAMADAQGEHDFMKMIQRVEEKTRANPDDGQAWSLLAKTYAATAQWPQALSAYERAIKLLSQDASVLSGYAEALAINNNRMLAGKPMEWVHKALEIDPEDIKGLELAGVYALQKKDFAQAGLYFKHLYNLLPPESPYAQDILAAQKQAEVGLAQSGGSAPNNPANSAAADDNTAALAAGAAIKGRIDIAPALKSRLAATDVLFVFARAGENGPPVAAMRASAGQFPLEFELNDSMAMNSANSLSRHKQVMLVARVSKSGNPIAQAGDFAGTLSNVKVGASGVKIVIDQIQP